MEGVNVVGSIVGILDGATEGMLVGDPEGTIEGRFDELAVGAVVSLAEGT